MRSISIRAGTCTSSRSRSLARREVTVVCAAVIGDGLRDPADEVHLDALLGRVPDGEVIEGGEIEVAAELAIDADEQVLVERGGDAERIVVGELQRRAPA